MPTGATRSNDSRRVGRATVRLVIAIVLAASGGAAIPQVFAQARSGSGQPVPRFVSLKSDRVLVRQGPGTDHKVLWVFSRAGLPVEVLQEADVWRQVRDQEGAVGWVSQALLSARRTGVVLAWEVGKTASSPAGRERTVPLFDGRSADKARTIALLEPGVICSIRNCDGTWCVVSVGDHKGFIEQAKLWGIYQGETIR